MKSNPWPFCWGKRAKPSALVQPYFEHVLKGFSDFLHMQCFHCIIWRACLLLLCNSSLFKEQSVLTCGSQLPNVYIREEDTLSDNRTIHDKYLSKLSVATETFWSPSGASKGLVHALETVLCWMDAVLWKSHITFNTIDKWVQIKALIFNYYLANAKTLFPTL